MKINCSGKLLDLTTPIVMGILNITNDSFYDGGKYTEPEKILKRAKTIIKEGAKIIDIGAYSSRPGATDIPEKIEIEKLNTALKIIRKHLPPETCISVDTFRAKVAKHVVEKYNVNIINDIYAGRGDNKMLQTIQKLQVPYIIMHMQGTPQNMQKNPTYQNIINDILKFFSERIKKATINGINDIIIDPGFGFGKTIKQNYQILNNLNHFKITKLPILVGISRKSMIYKTLKTTPNKALPATIALNTIAITKGANILRVHDVAQAIQTINITSELKKNEKI